jgi:hypothetical protein
MSMILSPIATATAETPKAYRATLLRMSQSMRKGSSNRIQPLANKGMTDGRKGIRGSSDVSSMAEDSGT